MKDWNDIKGQMYEKTGVELIELLENAVSEGFLSGVVSGGTLDRNVFGRTFFPEQSTDLSFLAGLVTTGLRASAFLSGSELTANHNQLAHLVREQLPALIYYSPNADAATSAAGYRPLPTLTDSGCFQLIASGAQAAVDLAVIAHRIAERALIPGICVLDDRITWNTHKVVFPTPDQLRQYLGEPDLHIAPPTPAQEIIFGKERRQVPQWFDLNAPVATGAPKVRQAAVLEAAAKERFFQYHLPAIIEESMQEYQRLTGRAYHPVDHYGVKPADLLIITQGSDLQQLIAAMEELQKADRIRVACLHISQLYPFPEKALIEAVKGSGTVAVLETVSGRSYEDTPLCREVKTAARLLGKRAPKVIAARCTGSISKEALRGLIRNMKNNRDQRTLVWLDVEFTRAGANSPQHEVLMQHIRRAYPEIDLETITADQSPPVQPAGRILPLPFSVRRYQDGGAPFTRLSRFYHDTACFYQHGLSVERVADPFQALPSMPAASAGLADVTAGRTEVPVFHPEHCTGCGRCFTYCPHSALPPIVIGVEALIRGGMDIAAGMGTPVAGLTPLVRKLAGIAGKALQEEGAAIRKVADFLPAAFELLIEQLQLSGDRLAKVREEMSILRQHIEEFPLAVTSPFFREPERIEYGTGALFSLAIDPSVCTGCGWCVTACEDGALSMEAETPEGLRSMLQNMEVWEKLPDTESAIIQRMVREEQYDPFAATLLSRNFYFSTQGGSFRPDAAPARTILHAVTALTESIMQPRLSAQVQRIEAQIEKLSDNIHRHLSMAIPHKDFQLDSSQLEDGKLPLETVMQNLQTNEQRKLIDTPVLRRKINLLNDLNGLRQNLQEGFTGNGQSRYGLMLAAPGMTSWAGQYPENIFTTPVVWHWDGSAPQRLRGILLGCRRHLLDHIRLLRRADLEIKDKYRPELHDREIGTLSWDDLNEEEIRLQAPLILIGGRELLSEANSSGLLALLSLDLPIKVIILDPANSHTNAVRAQANAVLFGALSLRKVRILKGSLAQNRFTFDAMRDGLYSGGPAWMHLYLPEPELHSVAAERWWELQELAGKTRAFPVFRYDPDLATGSMAVDLKIDANPDWNQTWVNGELHPGNDGDAAPSDYVFTYADWLYTQQAWRNAFRPLAEGERAILVADYLELEPGEQAGKVPVISCMENGNLKQYVVSAAVIEATQQARYHWDALRELAGALTPFPDKLRKQMEEVLTADYEQSIAAMRSDYEAKLNAQKNELMEEVHRKLTNKLLTLSRQRQLH